MDDLRIASSLSRALPSFEKPERTESPGSGFLERVKNVLTETDRLHKQAETEIRDLAHGSGRTTETMIALSRAELSMRFVVALRNRALEAYQEIMRLQV